MNQRRSDSLLDPHKQPDASASRQQQCAVQRAEMAAADGHGQRIGGECQGQQPGAQRIESGPFCLVLIDR
ncbi:hypothetical protein D3C84_1223530 [compost metagenome]